MKQLSKEWLDFLRRQFPEGSRIKLRKMGNDPRPVKPGSMGTLEYIDDIGTFHVKWDDGRELGLVLGEDCFAILPPLMQTIKLYSPLTADLFERNEYGDMDDDPVSLDGRSLVQYEGEILAALLRNRKPEEAERGVMHWYRQDDTIDQKVRSVVFTVDEREGQLWAVAECQVAGMLTPTALDDFIEYLGRQMSDGWGEGFEQREIRLRGGAELYVHLWQGENWSIMPEADRFDPKFPMKLPDMCWSVLPDDGSLIRIQRGIRGYQVSADSDDKPEINRHMASYRNQCRGISPFQEQAMLHGCQFGWGTPATKPKSYMSEPQQRGVMTLE